MSSDLSGSVLIFDYLCNIPLVFSNYTKKESFVQPNKLLWYDVLLFIIG